MDQFNRHKTSLKASEDDLRYMETELNTVLPDSYRMFAKDYGEAYTPELLDIIVDKELDLFDVQNISLPRESVDNTKAYWSAGMPTDFIGFGSDCMGNLFGFKRLEPPASRPPDAPVFVFDHDFVEVKPVASSFITFLENYVSAADGIT